MFIEPKKVVDSSGDELIFHDEIYKGKLEVEIKRLDHAGFPDDSCFYLTKDQVAEIKEHLDKMLVLF